MTGSTQPQAPGTATPWWGRFDVEEDGTFERRIGPLTIAVQRRASEWQIDCERFEDDNDAGPSSGPGTPPVHGATTQQHRYVFTRTTAPLRLLPALADRPIVSRPVTPFHLLGGEEISVYVSTPLWVRIEVGEPPKLLQEVPIVRPSDTWFGPSTLEGELCYASRTTARLSMANVPLRPDRAVTLVRIRNASQQTLHLERLSLPVPYLSLYASRDGLLWTQGVTLVRAEDGEMAELQIDAGAPADCDATEAIGKPRLTLDRTTLKRAWSLLFG